MLGAIFKRFTGGHYRKFLKECEPIVRKINEIEQGYQSLTDQGLQAKTREFMARVAERVGAVESKLADATDERRASALRDARQAALDDILPEAFAAVKNAARRLCGRELDVVGQKDVWNMVHYDVQLIGGIALHRRMISEMQTGEGKTLVSTAPLYLNALTGLNCQLITVNEYLAQRDSEWMGHLLRFLGLTVGCIKNQMDPGTKRAMYSCNVTYGTASEFGFDYLRDNGMARRREDQVQRGHYFCIIDEVDSILVDEARTPLIISGPSQDDTPMPFDRFKSSIQRMVRQQERLCGEWVDQAKKLIADPSGDRREAMRLLTQVKWGMPQNKQLMRLMEEGDIRGDLDKFDLELNADFQKKDKFAIKEALYFQIDEKLQQADLTENGRVFLQPNNPLAFLLEDLALLFNDIDQDKSLSPEEKVERKRQLELANQQTSEEIHTISQLLRAYCLYEKDQQYVVQDGKVQIVDENTGRVMPGRRWGDGLHQAIEAKEGVQIEKETKTYATITIQNYFRLYEKLAGMTGTAETEAGEFYDIYKLKVMVIPTHRPNRRLDLNDVFYKSRREKYNAVLRDIQQAHEKGQPILVGTASVEASELLSRMLKRANVPHSVLNAKYHAQEAEIVSCAGQRGAVTIATNMAGRGTDIKLGEGVDALGGLFVVGTERHESRRIDRQLRGRCARQGDPGVSKFFVSLEDSLMRLFANAGPMAKVLNSSLSDGEELSHPTLNWSIQNAQKKVEQQNYLTRKRLLSYDDVLNKQREVIYGIREDALTNPTPKDIILELIEEELEERVESFGEEHEALANWINRTFPFNVSEDDVKVQESAVLVASLFEKVKAAYAQKMALEHPDFVDPMERHVLLSSIDKNWQDHLTEMEELRRAVSLRSYGQKDPLSEYKSEGFRFFAEMMSRVRSDVCTVAFRIAANPAAIETLLASLQKKVQIQGPEEAGGGGILQQLEQGPRDAAMAAARGAGASAQRAPQPRAETAPLPKIEPVKRTLPKVGRNDVVVIRKGAKVEEMKFKKAEPLIENEGWSLVEVKKGS